MTQKNCGVCLQPIPEGQFSCPNCDSDTDGAATLKCKQCNGPMIKTKKGEHNMALQLLGVIVFIIGAIALFYVPVGTIIGILLILIAFSMGFKQRKIWKCKSCGYFFERS